jgi:hypothetical protein
MFGAAEARAVRDGFAKAFQLLIEDSSLLCAESILDLLGQGFRVIDKGRRVDNLPHTPGIYRPLR